MLDRFDDFVLRQREPRELRSPGCDHGQEVGFLVLVVLPVRGEVEVRVLGKPNRLLLRREPAYRDAPTASNDIANVVLVEVLEVWRPQLSRVPGAARRRPVCQVVQEHRDKATRCRRHTERLPDGPRISSTSLLAHSEGGASCAVSLTRAFTALPAGSWTLPILTELPSGSPWFTSTGQSVTQCWVGCPTGPEGRATAWPDNGHRDHREPT